MSPLTSEQQALIELWEEHLRCEFETSDTSATLSTMVDEAYVNHVPVLTGGRGKAELRSFYSTHFIPQMPPDTEIIPVSRTVGMNRLVDELVFKFTHTIQMDWLLPGIAPTNKRLELGLIVVVEFRDNKIACERIYWDQATVLVQLGLLNSDKLPVSGVESTHKILAPEIPSNQLIQQRVGDNGV